MILENHSCGLFNRLQCLRALQVRLRTKIAVAGTLTALALTPLAGYAAKLVNDSQYTASRVDLVDVSIEVDVRSWSKPWVQLQLMEADGRIDAFEIEHTDDRLTITQVDSLSSPLSILSVAVGDGKTQSSITINNDSIVTKGNGVTVSSSSTVPTPSLKLYLPDSVNLNFSRFSGNAFIDYLTGNLSFEGTGDLEAGPVASGEFKLTANADVTVEMLNGELNIDIDGNSDFSLRDGNVHSLHATGSGNAEATILAITESADITATDNADIVIKSVTGTRNLRTTRNADIEIRN